MRFCQIKMKDGTQGIIDLDKIVAIVWETKDVYGIWMGDKLKILVTRDEAESIERKLWLREWVVLRE